MLPSHVMLPMLHLQVPWDYSPTNHDLIHAIKMQLQRALFRSLDTHVIVCSTRHLSCNAHINVSVQ